MLKIKKVQLILCIMLITLTSALVLTTVFAFQKVNNADAGLKVQSSAYVISGSGKISKDTYKSYDDFEINSAEGLLGFAKNTTNLDSYPQFDWSGKTITLTNDIDCSSIEWPSVGGGNAERMDLFPFKGVFNGKFYTISNLRTPTVSTTETIWYNIYAPRIALFRYLDGATVKNVNVDGFEIFTADQASGFSVASINIAGIASVMTNEAKIQHCSVKNLSYSHNDPVALEIYCGGIAGAARDDCLIENCYVENFDINIGTVERVGVYPGEDEVYFSGIANSGAPTIRDCIFAKYKTNYESSWYPLSGVNYDEISYGNAIVEYCYYDDFDIDEMLTNLSISQFGNGRTWFYDENYNGGYPILSVFVKRWVRYEFMQNSSVASIVPEDTNLWNIFKNEYTIYYHYRRTIPIDLPVAFDMSNSEVSIGSAVLEVVFEPTYELDSWVYNEYYSAYYPKARRISYLCNFINSYSQFATMYVDGEEKSNYSINVIYGGYIKFDTSIDSNNITTYTYEIIELNKTKATIYFVINLSKYAMLKDTGGKTYANGLNGLNRFDVEEPITIEPKFCLKTYKVEFD